MQAVILYSGCMASFNGTKVRLKDVTAAPPVFFKGELMYGAECCLGRELVSYKFKGMLGSDNVLAKEIIRRLYVLVKLYIL